MLLFPVFPGLIGFIIALIVPPVLWKASQAAFITVSVNSVRVSSLTAHCAVQVFTTKPDEEDRMKRLRIRVENGQVLFGETPPKGDTGFDRFPSALLLLLLHFPQETPRGSGGNQP